MARRCGTRISINELSLIKLNDDKNEINNENDYTKDVKSSFDIDRILMENILCGFNKIFKKFGNGFTMKMTKCDDSYKIKGSTLVDIDTKENFEIYKTHILNLIKVLDNGFYKDNSFSELITNMNKMNEGEYTDVKIKPISFDGIEFLFSMFHYKFYITIWKKIKDNSEYYKFIGKSKINISTPGDYGITYQMLSSFVENNEEKGDE